MAQNTFTEVYHLLKQNCATAGCHDGSSPQFFDATLPEAQVYSSLVDAKPANINALNKGDKLVTRGYPARSFLLRKIAHGISAPLVIDSAEGSSMPPDAPLLADHEIELVRQWILHGAPLTGNVVDTALINSYYREGGIDDTYPSHNPPPAGQGFQIYVGKIFIPPHGEREFNYKVDLRLTEDIEIYKYQTMLPNGTHHFKFSRFTDGLASNYPDGLRYSWLSHGDTEEEIGSGAGLWEEDLPEGTAYFWNKSTVIDLNLHLRNTHSAILGTDLFINLYTQPVGTADEYMSTHNYSYLDIVIPNGGAEHVFTVTAQDTTAKRMWNIWMLYTHTHELCKDYDVWIRNYDGTKGAQVYEGFYNQDYTFNQGYYAWGVDVAVRRFTPPFLVVDPRLGLIHRAKYVNNGTDTVRNGRGHFDEMMVVGFQYFYGDSLGPIDTTTAVQAVSTAENHFNLFPNPVETVFSINYILQRASEVSLELTNIFGQTSTIFKQTKPAGNFLESIELGDAYPPGAYVVTLRTEGEILKKNIVMQ